MTLTYWYDDAGKVTHVTGYQNDVRAASDPLPWEYDDGGRATAGFSGETGDCGVRAVAIAMGRPYADVYVAFSELGKRERRTKRRRRQSHPRTGIHRPTFRKYMAAAGWVWVPTMGIGTGCRVHLRRGELPCGRLIVNLSRHYAAVVDGVVRDTYDPSRDGTRCVYGYWRAPV